MGLQLPRRSAGKKPLTVRRAALLAAVGISVLALGGCSSEWNRFAMPEPASVQGERILSLWQGAWVAALITGVIVWGLIFYVIIKYRRRSDDEIPVQTRYNLPLEIFYTIAPVIMVIVFFFHTVEAQNYVLDEDAQGGVDNTVEVVGQQWSWTFNYGLGERNSGADEDAADEDFPYSSYVHVSGTGSQIPTLVLPVDQTTRFNLHSPDVIHDFGVPGFLMKMDVIPGRVNQYAITPTEIGSYLGKCFELCGVYHSRMLFNVEVVSQADYESYLEDLEDAGATTELPVLGGENASTQAGLDEDPEGEGK